MYAVEFWVEGTMEEAEEYVDLYEALMVAGNMVTDAAHDLRGKDGDLLPCVIIVSRREIFFEATV